MCSELVDHDNDLTAVYPMTDTACPGCSTDGPGSQVHPYDPRLPAFIPLKYLYPAWLLKPIEWQIKRYNIAERFVILCSPTERSRAGCIGRGRWDSHLVQYTRRNPHLLQWPSIRPARRFESAQNSHIV